MPLDDLVRRVRDREPRSLPPLMEQHGPHVYSLALRITGSEADALYVVKEVFVALPEALDRFDGDDFRAWLTSFTIGRAYRHVYSGEPDGASPGGEAAISDWPPAANSAVAERHSAARKLARRELESAIARLNDDRRLVFMLKEVEGLSHDEVAVTLGISPGASRVRLHRARQALIKHFRAGNLGMKHPTQFMMSRFLDDDLPAGTREPIDEHLEVCVSCRQYVAWLSDLRHVARTLRRPQPMPPHIADGVARRRRDRELNPGTS